MNDITKPIDGLEEAKEFIRLHGKDGPFEACSRYNNDLDCLTIRFQDCSFFEVMSEHQNISFSYNCHSLTDFKEELRLLVKKYEHDLHITDYDIDNFLSEVELEKNMIPMGIDIYSYSAFAGFNEPTVITDALTLINIMIQNFGNTFALIPVYDLFERVRAHYGEEFLKKIAIPELQ